ncbi:MAG: hypothetical protein HQL96_09840 [Magnetococcales bacterium]|nr:hypothetical protein [Magnetococcales bacterium]
MAGDRADPVHIPDRSATTKAWLEDRDMERNAFINFLSNVSSRLPIQAEGGFPGAFGQWFEKDLPWIRTEWPDRFSVPASLRESRIWLFLTAPVIWSVSIPLLLLDLMATLYQTICFPVYGIPTVDRSEFVIMDRHKLAYLNWLEKLNCVYCGYGNGVLAYVREIASRTEERWCPIKHAKTPRDTHPRYIHFAEYGDEKDYLDKKSKQ